MGLKCGGRTWRSGKPPRSLSPFPVRTPYSPCPSEQTDWQTGRQTGGRQGGLLFMTLPAEEMEEWEFVQRDGAVPIAHSRWRCLCEGQVSLWLTGEARADDLCGRAGFGKMVGANDLSASLCSRFFRGSLGLGLVPLCLPGGWGHRAGAEVIFMTRLGTQPGACVLPPFGTPLRTRFLCRPGVALWAVGLLKFNPHRSGLGDVAGPWAAAW